MTERSLHHEVAFGHFHELIGEGYAFDVCRKVLQLVGSGVIEDQDHFVSPLVLYKGDRIRAHQNSKAGTAPRSEPIVPTLADKLQYDLDPKEPIVDKYRHKKKKIVDAAFFAIPNEEAQMRRARDWRVIHDTLYGPNAPGQAPQKDVRIGDKIKDLTSLEQRRTVLAGLNLTAILFGEPFLRITHTPHSL